VENFGLTPKDTMTLLSLDDGDRLEYFREVIADMTSTHTDDIAELGRVTGNW